MSLYLWLALSAMLRLELHEYPIRPLTTNEAAAYATCRPIVFQYGDVSVNVMK